MTLNEDHELRKIAWLRTQKHTEMKNIEKLKEELELAEFRHEMICELIAEREIDE